MGEGRLQAFLPRAEVGVSLFCHEQNKGVHKISLAQTLRSTLASLFNPQQDLMRSCLLALGCLLLTSSGNTVGRMLGQLFEDLREAAEPWLSRQSASTSFSLLKFYRDSLLSLLSPQVHFMAFSILLEAPERWREHEVHINKQRGWALGRLRCLTLV